MTSTTTPKADTAPLAQAVAATNAKRKRSGRSDDADAETKRDGTRTALAAAVETTNARLGRRF